MVVALLLLAAPVVAAVLFWGAWAWVAAAAVVAVVEYATLRRSQRFSARVWRSVGMTRRGKRERAVEVVYVVSAAVGVALLVGSVFGIVDGTSSSPHRRHSDGPATTPLASGCHPDHQLPPSVSACHHARSSGRTSSGWS